MEHRRDYHPHNKSPYEGPKISFETRLAELERKKEQQPVLLVKVPPSTTKTVFTCIKCNLKFSSRLNCESHLKRVHEGT